MAPASASQRTTLTGTVQLPSPDGGGGHYPCSFCELVFYDYDNLSPDDFLHVTATGSDGSFSINVDNDDAGTGGVEPYLNVFTLSPSVHGDEDVQVLDPSSKLPYVIETHVLRDDCPDGTCDLGTINLDEKVDNSPSSAGHAPTDNDWAAFYILRVLLLSTVVDRASAGFATVPLTSYFPAEGVPAAADRPISAKYGAEWRPCDPVEEPDSMPPRPAPGVPEPPAYACVNPKHTVLVGSVYAYFGLTIAHEVGHGLMYMLHAVAGTDAALGQFDCAGLGHFFTTVSSEGCAYSEGFAHFHGGVVFSLDTGVLPMLTYIVPHWNDTCTDSEEEREAPACYSGEDTFTFDLETRGCVSAVCPAPAANGKRVEGNVGATFWDLIDGNADGSDAASIAVGDLLGVIVTHGAYAHAGGPVTLAEFESSWTAAGFAAATLTSVEQQSTTDLP